MGTVAGLLVLGLVLGVKHALEADHVAAVAALATRSRTVRHTVWQGIVWGLGHTLTLFVFGGLIWAMGNAVPARLATLLEGAVGVMLIVLGIDVFRRLITERVHVHVHRHHGGVVHIHAHSHEADHSPHDPLYHEHVHPQGFPLRALFVGIMHGMAGTAALILVMASGTKSIVLGLAQIAAFGLGSIVGMAALSVVIAIPLRVSARAFRRIERALKYVVAIATLALGGSVLYGALNA